MCPFVLVPLNLVLNYFIDWPRLINTAPRASIKKLSVLILLRGLYILGVWPLEEDLGTHTIKGYLSTSFTHIN